MFCILRMNYLLSDRRLWIRSTLSKNKAFQFE